MPKYTSISVRKEVKQQLKLLKGNKTWGEYLLEMCNEAKAEKVKSNDREKSADKA